MGGFAKEAQDDGKDMPDHYPMHKVMKFYTGAVIPRTRISRVCILSRVGLYMRCNTQAYPSIPDAHPPNADGATITVISGKSHGVESPVKPIGGCWYFDIKMDKEGQTIFQEIRMFGSKLRTR